ncbi:acyl-CoA desaturase [Homoserinibacter sp. YIM 151385]|nr:acyl-CoA desaturase [Homoserinibacter sp. YIM 151385]WBU38466.1 acyl-CoA desaturase [Homoserinibacter sp. YIM 151385]
MSTFSALLATVREAGLLRRRRGFYAIVLGVLVLALGGCVAGYVLLGHSWFQLLIAGALGIVFTQFAFLAHEASHRQVFESGRANDRAGRILAAGVVGISYSWWMTKHTRHHANPNMVGRDPDIELDTISFLEEDAASAGRLRALLTRRQGYLFFPLLAFEGINLHVRSMGTLFGRERIDGRALEISLVATRILAYLAVLFLTLPVGMAFAFLGVQLAVFGIYMGASFAPNHKGMAIIPAGTRMDFLRKQVLTSRNIRGGWGMTLAFGGLNHQVEHHLFPSMPRPALARAREIVREHCAVQGIPYTEATLLESYRAVIAYLNRVGLSARDPFDCPLVNRYRRA